MRGLDLGCCAGGCSVGFARAGHEMVGVDIRPQPHYPFEFHLGDMLTWPLAGFDFVHVSPPCQKWTPMAHLHPDRVYPDLITPMRARLQAWGGLFLIENVPGAPLRRPVLICGSMFDPPMDVKRHRLFETNWPCSPPMWPCRHGLYGPRFPAEDRRMKHLSRFVGVYGGGRYKGSDALRARAMGIDWMTREELTQAIPPNYTEHIGRQLTAHKST